VMDIMCSGASDGPAYAFSAAAIILQERISCLSIRFHRARKGRHSKSQRVKFRGSAL
jgi:hypothetical protein